MQIKPLYFQFLVGACVPGYQNATVGKAKRGPTESKRRRWLADWEALIRSFTHSFIRSHREPGALVLRRDLASLAHPLFH